jgi:hypothetical protein
MKRVLVAALALCAVFIPEAAKADVSLGANFGVGAFFPRRSESYIGVGWPYSSLGTMPGLRVGFELADAGKHELYLDTTAWAQGNPNIRFAMVLVAYQHNLTPREPNTFYFTAGGGPVFVLSRGDDFVTFMAGGGVGFRQRVSQGHGTFREELRADFLPGTDYTQRTFIVSLKFGFDLWFR